MDSKGKNWLLWTLVAQGTLSPAFKLLPKKYLLSEWIGHYVIQGSLYKMSLNSTLSSMSRMFVSQGKFLPHLCSYHIKLVVVLWACDIVVLHTYLDTTSSAKIVLSPYSPRKCLPLPQELAQEWPCLLHVVLPNSSCRHKYFSPYASIIPIKILTLIYGNYLCIFCLSIRL